MIDDVIGLLQLKPHTDENKKRTPLFTSSQKGKERVNRLFRSTHSAKIKKIRLDFQTTTDIGNNPLFQPPMKGQRQRSNFGLLDVRRFQYAIKVSEAVHGYKKCDLFSDHLWFT